MHHCRVGKNCLCQWLQAQEIIPEKEKEREKGSDREKNTMKQTGWKREGEILFLMNHHFHVSADALQIPTSVPPNQASLWHPSTNPTPVFLCRHTHRHTDTHAHSHKAQVFAVTSRRNAGCWWESLPHCSCHIRSTARRPWAYACGVCVWDVGEQWWWWGGLGLGLCLRASPALQKTPLNSG